jgi:hypothetical protein
MDPRHCAELQLFFTIPVLVPTFDKLRFRFDFRQVTVKVPVLGSTPYLDHKKHLKKKN